MMQLADPSDIVVIARGLLGADWENPDGCIQLGLRLHSDDLKSAPFFQNTRCLLAALEAGSVAATASGNLNRAFVGRLFETMTLPQRVRESIRQFSKVINEQDLWPLHISRVVAECAGLVARRRKRFQLTKLGRELVDDQQAGALYRKLFLAYFQKFDLRYEFQLRDVPGIQETMAFVLWRLDSIAQDWVPVQGLTPQVLLPGVLGQLRAAMRSEFDTEEWILAGYVLNPLYDLGLIETRSRSGWPDITEKDFIRTTTLWRKFIRFDVRSALLAIARN